MVVEGWRGINHSYALVNHCQLRELRRQSLELFHRDMPFFNERWNPRENPHGFRQEDYDEIACIPPPPDELEPSVTYRIFWPIKFTQPRTKRLFVFGTSEFQNVPDNVSADELREGLANADHTIVTPSQWSAEGFRRAGFERILVIPHGVDPMVYKPPSSQWRAEFRQALNFRDDEFVLLNVGAMTQNKGIEDLVTAYAMVRRTHPHVRLVLKDQRLLYGHYAKDLVDKLQAERPQLIDDALTASIVYLSQNMTMEQLAGLYGAADCYVSPYLAEGFNLPPLEAAACGTPIVVTRGGSTDDYVDESFALQIDSVRKFDGQRHYVRPSLDSLVEQLLTLIEKKADRIDQNRAVELIQRKFSWHAVVQQLVAAMFG